MGAAFSNTNGSTHLQLVFPAFVLLEVHFQMSHVIFCNTFSRKMTILSSSDGTVRPQGKEPWPRCSADRIQGRLGCFVHTVRPYPNL